MMKKSCVVFVGYNLLDENEPCVTVKGVKEEDAKTIQDILLKSEIDVMIRLEK